LSKWFRKIVKNTVDIKNFKKYLFKNVTFFKKYKILKCKKWYLKIKAYLLAALRLN